MLIKKLFLIVVYVFICSLSYAETDSPKICLNMIVKNESKIIERCLDNVKNIVNYVSICDTGSTDNTVEIVENYLKKNNIPGKVHHHEWKNFGHNRTLSVKAAQETLKELGFPLEKTYLLLLDADMILIIKPDFNPKLLFADSYMLTQKNWIMAYYNTRLIRASLPWESVGVTHEYWAAKNQGLSLPLTSLEIDDREDGGCKSDKFVRDIKLLTQGLQDEPENFRYMFYLGQSYKCNQQFDDAIKWYKMRVEKGGWNEEVWHAKYMIGDCYKAKGEWNNALEAYLEAYNYLPERSEPLHCIAKYYLDNGKPIAAFPFALTASKISYPKNHLLFVEHPLYEYESDEDLAISGNYTPSKTEGYDALNRLLISRTIPKDRKDLAYRNLRFYIKNLQNALFIPIKIELPLLREGSSEHFNASNPSIIKTESGYKMICRTHNFEQKNGKNYRSRDPLDPTVKTINFLLEYDKKFNLISQKEIREGIPRIQIPSGIRGLEDCRLIHFKGRDAFTCSVFDLIPNQIIEAFCLLSSQSSDKTVQIEKMVPLKGPSESSCEKNWLPFDYQNKLLMVYSYEPFTIYEVNIDTGNCEIFTQYKPKQDFSHFRGSAPPIRFEDGFLFLVHEVIFNNGERTYAHRFVYLNKDFKITRLSKPFTFKHIGVEYCCGMTFDHSGEKCIMTIGIEDKEAFFCVVDLKIIRDMLEDIDTH